jgi:Ca-activated chloride channel family protein
MDHAMVSGALNRLNDLSLAVQLLLISVIAVAIMFWIKGAEGAALDLFLTKDQQGRLLYEDLKFQDAAEAFEDPAWKGTAQFRSGQYPESADSFGRMASAEGFYNRGNAFMRAREYRKAIASYEQAVADRPDWIEAQENLELARYTVDYVERSREQGDTGEQSGIGADDVVYDNEGERGTDTEVTRESAVEAQSAEKWMRSVDTETADFLRSRFLLEASREGRL